MTRVKEDPHLVGWWFGVLIGVKQNMDEARSIGPHGCDLTINTDLLHLLAASGYWEKDPNIIIILRCAFGMCSDTNNKRNMVQELAHGKLVEANTILMLRLTSGRSIGRGNQLELTDHTFFIVQKRVAAFRKLEIHTIFTLFLA